MVSHRLSNLVFMIPASLKRSGLPINRRVDSYLLPGILRLLLIVVGLAERIGFAMPNASDGPGGCRLSVVLNGWFRIAGRGVASERLQRFFEGERSIREWNFDASRIECSFYGGNDFVTRLANFQGS